MCDVARKIRRALLGVVGAVVVGLQVLAEPRVPEVRSLNQLPKVVAESWCQFHQHFTHSFYTRRSQKRKNDSQVVSLFYTLGICVHKSFAHKMFDIDPRLEFLENTFFLNKCYPSKFNWLQKHNNSCLSVSRINNFNWNYYEWLALAKCRGHIKVIKKAHNNDHLQFMLNHNVQLLMGVRDRVAKCHMGR